MSPHSIASEADLTATYLDALGYGKHPGESPDFRTAVERLDRQERVLLVAWLGPYIDAWPQRGGTSHEPESVVERTPEDVAAGFRRFFATAVKASDRPASDVAAHLGWRASLSVRDVNRLLDGHDGFSIRCILEVCEALQLEFRDRWRLIDTERLKLRIDESLTALRIVQRLRGLSSDQLETVYRRLPTGSSDASPAGPFYPPPPNTRYRPLFELLASEEHKRPALEVRAIERVLQERREGTGLPRSAFVDRSWWAGTGSKTAGRPQVSAWWAAGYRVGTLETDAETGEVLTVTFEALPGRDDWFADPRRLVGYGVREQGSEPEWRPIVGNKAVQILLPQRLRLSMSASDFRTAPSSDNPGRREVPERTSENDKDLIDRLVHSLDTLGEADRAAVATELNVDISDTELSNLLTRARRRGRVVNHGTRTRPRWVVAGSKGDLVFEIGRLLSFVPPPIGPGSVIRRQFFEQVAHRLNLKVPKDALTTDIVRTITASAGIEWSPTFVSSGMIVTLAGVEAVRNSVRVHTRPANDGTDSPRRMRGPASLPRVE